MPKTNNPRPTIGIVLSSVPRYSETFFRSKISSLQNNGFKVILFVEYLNSEDLNFPCPIVAAPDFGKGPTRSFFYIFLIFLKLFFVYPFPSYRLFMLDKKDGIGLKRCLRNLIVNQFLITRNLDWLHFGYGMLVVNRENIAKAIGARMAVSFRGADLYLSPLKHPNCYDSLFQKEVKYHVLSKEMKVDLLNYNISVTNIKVISPAINIEFFQSEGKSTRGSIVNLVTVARLHWKKGLEYTLTALKSLKEKGMQFHYTIIGDGDEMERLVFARYQLGLKDEVTFAGKMTQANVKRHLEESDIYLQYSIQEGFCNAVLEAQAMGLMCIVSNAEGLSENVLDGQTGWVVPKREPELLAQKIMEVSTLNKEFVESIRNRSVSRVKSQFNLDSQNKSFIDFYLD